jgi:hypothetical protein
MKIQSIHPDIERAYFSPEFLTIIESHLTHLRQSEGLKALPVSEHQGYKYEGDFFGLLDDLRIEKKYHHIALRVNDMKSSADYKGDMKFVLIPAANQIEILKTILQTSEENID